MNTRVFELFFGIEVESFELVEAVWSSGKKWFLYARPDHSGFWTAFFNIFPGARKLAAEKYKADIMAMCPEFENVEDLRDWFREVTGMGV